MYEEAIQTVVTVRDFTQVFDAYAQFEETMIAETMESSAESETEIQDSKQSKNVSTGTKHKPGIIYLSKVPSGFNVSQTTSFFSEFGR